MLSKEAQDILDIARQAFFMGVGTGYEHHKPEGEDYAIPLYLMDKNFWETSASQHILREMERLGIIMLEPIGADEGSRASVSDRL